MADYLVRCECGVETPVSEWAIGAPLRCKGCKRPLEPGKSNTRLAPEDAPKRPKESDLPISPEGRMHARRERDKPASKAAPSRPAAPAPPTPTLLPPEQPEAPVRATNCARCGRDFRGDWDRYHRAAGVLCHVCANMAPDKKDEEAETASAASSPPKHGGFDYQGVLDHPVLPRQDGESPADRTQRESRTQQWVLLAAIVTLALAIIGIASDNASVPDAATAGQEAAHLPAWATAVVLLTVFAFRALTLGSALYAVLRWRDRLPSDFLPGNIVTLGAWALGLQLLQAAMGVVPYGGLIWIGVCVYILWDQFDLSPMDFMLVGVFLLVVHPLALLLRTLAEAAIGHFVH